MWAFGDSVWAYESFEDVVVFDTTCLINWYDMPLGLWIKIDKHGNSIFFGCVIFRDEKISSFTWALKVSLYNLKCVTFSCYSMYNCKRWVNCFTFFFLFQSFLNFVNGKYPQTILTDQDLALKEAISRVTLLPDTSLTYIYTNFIPFLTFLRDN